MRRFSEVMDLIEWPWLARMSQSDGSVELAGGGVESDGLGFREKRCFAFSVTAVWMSVNVTWRDLRRGHFICGLVSKDHVQWCLLQVTRDS